MDFQTCLRYYIICINDLHACTFFCSLLHPTAVIDLTPPHHGGTLFFFGWHPLSVTFFQCLQRSSVTFNLFTYNLHYKNAWLPSYTLPLLSLVKKVPPSITHFFQILLFPPSSLKHGYIVKFLLS